MISIIGEAPVNTLGGTSVPVTVVQAETRIRRNKQSDPIRRVAL